MAHIEKCAQDLLTKRKSPCLLTLKKGYSYDMFLVGNSMTEQHGVACQMGSHNVTCHPTQANIPRLNTPQPVRLVLNLNTYSGGMED